jgi:hypothetical protein
MNVRAGVRMILNNPLTATARVPPLCYLYSIFGSQSWDFPVNMEG